ncbi:hypothetical protein ACLI4Z_03600 [Natrialbaceae archaeon A-arb3/5]
MAESVDVQEQTIGVGTVLAIVFFGYGTFINETILGIDATELAAWVFVGTFAAVALFHSAYGRRDFAVAHAAAAVGVALVLLATSGPQVLVGMGVLLTGGSYIVSRTIRARRDQT